MTKDDVAQVFEEMADLLEIRGHDPHRSRAFRTTARKLRSLRTSLGQALASGALARTKGVGEGSLSRIKEVLRTGSCEAHRRLLREVPPGLRDLLKLKGLGPAHVRRLFQQQRIENLDGLERALRAGPVPGIDQELGIRLLANLDRLRRGAPPLLLDQARRLGAEVLALLDEEPSCDRAAQAGSARRGKPLIKDLDVLIASDRPGDSIRAVLDGLTVEERYAVGDTRASVRLEGDVQLDLRALPLPSWGAGMHYFTGSGAHNIALRKRANARGLGLSEHGLRRLSDEMLLSGCPREEDVFAGLELPFIAPELREDAGEIELAEAGRLPDLPTGQDLVVDHWTRPARPEDITPLSVEAARRNLRELWVTVNASRTSPTEDPTWEEAAHAATVRTDVQVRLALEVPLADVDEASQHLARAAHTPFEGRCIGVLPAGDERPSDDVLALIATGDLTAVAGVSGRTLPDRPRVRSAVDDVVTALLKGEAALMVSGNPAHLDADEGTVRLAVGRGVAVALASEARAPREFAWLDLALSTARRGHCPKASLRDTGVDSAVLRARAQVAMEDVDTTLLNALIAPVLDEATQDRLGRFLREGDDPGLEACLRALGPNPLQVAYTLSIRAGPQILDPDS